MNLNQKQELMEFMRRKHYSERTIVIYIRCFNSITDEWDTDEPKLLYEHIKKALCSFDKTSLRSTAINFRAAAHIWFLMKTGMTVKEFKIKNQKCDLFGNLLEDFYDYSTKFKKVIPATARAEISHVKVFLTYCNAFSIDNISKIDAYKIRDYVCTELSLLQPSSIGRYITSIRNFFRFLEYKNININSEIFHIPLSSADWNKRKMPVTLNKDEEKRLRTHYCMDTARDKRNNAIVLLMLDGGLRCSEIPEIRISDIKWSNGTLCINHTKTKQIREIPITKELGLALEDYILHFRFNFGDDHLFLNIGNLNKNTPMNCEGVRRIIRQAFKKENITGDWKGTHALRRTAASRIYNSGAGLKVTADILGHASLEATVQYVKVDINSLRMAVSTWAGGDTNEN